MDTSKILPYSVLQRLSYDEMNRVTNLFSEISSQALSEYPAESVKKIEDWVIDVGLASPHVLFSDNNFHFFEDAANHPIVRDFIMRVHFTFFAFAGNEANFINRLTQNLVDALCLDGADPQYSALPEDIQALLAIPAFGRNTETTWSERLFGKMFGYRKNHLSLFMFLRNNTWIMVILLIHLCGVEQPPADKVAEANPV